MGDELTMRDINVEKAIAALTEQMKAVFKRVDEQKTLVESVYKIATAQEVMSVEIKRQGEVQERLRVDIDALRMHPAKRWEAIVGQVISLLVAAAAGGVLMKAFGG